MKVNYVSTYVKKKVKLNKKETKIGQYGKRLEVGQYADIEDITSIANILLSYCHVETNGSLMVDGCDRVTKDFDVDLDLAQETFEEEINKLEVRGVNLDCRDIKEALFS